MISASAPTGSASRRIASVLVAGVKPRVQPRDRGAVQRPFPVRRAADEEARILPDARPPGRAVLARADAVTGDLPAFVCGRAVDQEPALGLGEAAGVVARPVLSARRARRPGRARIRRERGMVHRSQRAGLEVPCRRRVVVAHPGLVQAGFGLEPLAGEAEGDGSGGDVDAAEGGEGEKKTVRWTVFPPNARSASGGPGSPPRPSGRGRWWRRPACPPDGRGSRWYEWHRLPQTEFTCRTSQTGDNGVPPARPWVRLGPAAPRPQSRAWA